MYFRIFLYIDDDIDEIMYIRIAFSLWNVGWRTYSLRKTVKHLRSDPVREPSGLQARFTEIHTNLELLRGERLPRCHQQ